VKQLPPGWLIIGILSFILKGKLCIFPVKCCLTREKECFGVGSWNLFRVLFVRDFLFMLLFYQKKIVLKRKYIKSLLSQKTVNALAFSIKISCKQLLHYLCSFMDVVPV